MSLSNFLNGVILFFWLLIVIIYPALISIYVQLPLFIGFSGLMLINGLEEKRSIYLIFALIYMLSLEINLSLPLMLIPISTLVFYIYVKNKLLIFKHCKRCISILTVVSINLIYFIMILIYDFFTSQSSVDFNVTIFFSILFDILAAVVI
jgi:hypothetical protein